MRNPLPLMQVSEVLELFLLECSRAEASEAASGWADSGLVTRLLRGRKMRTVASLFDEVSAALQFPWYFGENAGAFDECLAELEGLPRQSGYVFLINDPQLVLSEEKQNALVWLTDSLTRACEEWSREVDSGEWWDRPAVPFHVVLQVEPEAAVGLAARWTAAGARVVPFPS